MKHLRFIGAWFFWAIGDVLAALCNFVNLYSAYNSVMLLSERIQGESEHGPWRASPSPFQRRKRMSGPPLTVEDFIENFRRNTGWKCEPATRITKELTAFAAERIGSTRDIEELHVIFCMHHSIKPYMSADDAS